MFKSVYRDILTHYERIARLLRNQRNRALFEPQPQAETAITEIFLVIRRALLTCLTSLS